MKTSNFSSKSATRFLLGMLGLGTAGTALNAAVVPDNVFAKQFLGTGEVIQIPKLVYDPSLQMMVDPVTRQPIYSNSSGGKIKIATAVVTSGCGDCPKNDGCKDNYGC